MSVFDVWSSTDDDLARLAPYEGLIPAAREAITDELAARGLRDFHRSELGADVDGGPHGDFVKGQASGKLVFRLVLMWWVFRASAAIFAVPTSADL